VLWLAWQRQWRQVPSWQQRLSSVWVLLSALPAPSSALLAEPTGHTLLEAMPLPTQPATES